MGEEEEEERASGGEKKETRRDIKRQMDQHAKFSFCRPSDGRTDGRVEFGRDGKGLFAIIISPALPVIAIVLTNAQIAFQIAPSPP